MAFRSISRLSCVDVVGSKKRALQLAAASTWRSSGTVDRVVSMSTTLMPILAAASSVMCFSAESGSHSASVSPLVKPCSSSAFACESANSFTSPAVHLMFLPVYRTASRIGRLDTESSNLATSEEAARREPPSTLRLRWANISELSYAAPNLSPASRFGQACV